MVLQYSVNKTKYPLDEKVLKNCDVNGDDVIDSKDAFYIQQADAGIIELPVAE